MENIFVEFLPPWVETGLQPAFYDKESGTVLQQTARMYARVNMLIRMFNKLSKNTKETVEDYINRFNELYTYVHDYFDNLDVQEEINNKLDQMADEGTLQEIIAAYLNANALWCADTNEDVSSLTNLVEGSFVETFGYKRVGDGVYNIYKIRQKAEGEVADGYDLIDISSNNSLVAERMQYGKKVVIELLPTDDIQDYLDLECDKTIILPPNSTYTYNNRLYLNSNTELDLNNSTLVVDYEGETLILAYRPTDTFTKYNGYKNITIRNGTIISCICFMHNKNVTLENVEFKEQASRHAIQLASCYNFTVRDCIFNGSEAYNTTSCECVNIDPCSYGAQPFIPSGSVMFDHTNNMNVLIENNTFKNSTKEGHRYTNGVGTHSRDDDGQLICDGLIIRNNNFGSPYYSAINLSDYKNVTIDGNKCYFTNDKNARSPFTRFLNNHENVAITNNNVEGCSTFVEVWDTSEGSVRKNFVISNNVVKTDDTASYRANTFRNVHNCAIINNQFTCNKTAIMADANVIEDTTITNEECRDLSISNNIFNITSPDEDTIRIRICINTSIEGNTFNYSSNLVGDKKTIGILATSVNTSVTNNKTNKPYQFTGVSLIRGNFRKNQAFYLLASGYGYTDLSGEGDFNFPLTYFKSLRVMLGHTGNMESVKLLPWVGINEYEHFDTTNRTWKIPVVKDDDSAGHVNLSVTNESTHYSFSGDIALRQIYGVD